MVFEAELVMADTPALDASAVFTPSETFTFSAYVSTVITLSIGPSFSVGSSIAVASFVAFCAQNLVGNHPRRWEHTGKVLECKEFFQYLVSMGPSWQL